MPFNIERLDDSTPRDFSVKQINPSFRADMLRFTLVHRLDRFSQFVNSDFKLGHYLRGRLLDSRRPS
jgi:hypothetical protein